MNDLAIRVEGLSKKYHIGGKQERYRTFRDTLTDAFTSPFRKVGRILRGHATGAAGLNETIWALKDVSFEIKHGDVVGIIGRNGAGKSTLLKILSRITEPTEGYADIYGRVGSLLEVGTGFHAELTGRENIYLNGAILGMKKAEIEKKFDEIVAFAEVEKFINTPVKHYSTGMYLRLAFAVAAHLEPEILLVDEVLAVGDTQFQNKCLGKMKEVGKEGRTVIFVSHNMGVIDRLCKKILYLRDGQVVDFGDNYLIARYISDTSDLSFTKIHIRKDREGRGRIRATSIEAKSCEYNGAVRSGDHVSIEIGYEVSGGIDLNNVTVALGIDDMMNNRIITLWSKFNNEVFSNVCGRKRFMCEIPELRLTEGSYLVHIYIDSNGIVEEYVHNAYKLNVGYGKFYNSGLEPTRDQGYIMERYQWTIV